MIRKSLYRIVTLVLAVCCLALPLATAGAQTVTLESLLRGGSITIFDKVFSNFQFTSIGTGGAASAQSANITVTSLADDPLNPGLFWSGGNVGVTLITGPPAQAEAGEWDVDAGQTQVTSLSFDVSTVSGEKLIKDNTLGLGSAGVINPGEVKIDESVAGPNQTLLGEKQVFLRFNDFKQTDHIEFAPQNHISVATLITLDSHIDGAAALASFSQRFSQVPEPGSIVLLGAGITGTVLFRFRRQR